MKKYSVITREFPRESNQTEEFREKNHSQNIRPFERIKTLTKANHPIGIVMYYVKSFLIVLGAIRVAWVKLKISRLQFLIMLTKERLMQNGYPEIIDRGSCSALSHIFTSIHGGFVKHCSSAL